MIVDCYTHAWENSRQLGRCVPTNGRSGAPRPTTSEASLAGVSKHLAAAKPVDITFILAFKSRHLEAEIPNEWVASYARNNPDRLIGFAGVDPSDPKEAIETLQYARRELAMPGIAIAPAAQDFHPSNSRAMMVYGEAAEAGLPVIFHTGVHILAATKLEYARPALLDEVAREFPTLKIVVAHMGFPWINETLVLLAKHSNVFAEVSWLLSQPWQAYQALLSAHQYGVMDRLLFGSGFPTASASHCIEEIYGINHFCHGTNLPTIPREQLRGIVERDALSLLGIAPPSAKAEAPALTVQESDE